MGKKIIRFTVKTSMHISGYYRYENIFQIIDSSKKDSNLFEKWCDIEFDINAFEVMENVVNNKADEDYKKIKKGIEHVNSLKILLSLLSIATNSKFTNPNNNWDQNNIDCGEIIEEFSDISEKYEIRREQNRINQDMNPTMSFLSIQDTEKIYFKNYFSLRKKEKKRYNSSIFLYYNMDQVRLISASLAIVGYISAIENLTDFESQRKGEKIPLCSMCNKPTYSIARKFKDFMKKYSEFSEDENANKILNDFYSKRSKISHAGELMYMDYIQNEFSAEEYRYLVKLTKHIRVALYNYLICFKKIPNKSNHIDP